MRKSILLITVILLSGCSVPVAPVPGITPTSAPWQISLDKYVFIEQRISKYGEILEGEYLGPLIDFPRYGFDKETGTLFSGGGYSKLNLKVDETLKVVFGHGLKLSGCAGGGESSDVAGVYRLPYEYEGFKVVKIESDGTAHLEYEGASIVLRSGQEWSKVESVIDTKQSEGKTGKAKITTTDKIVNYGILDKSRINSNPPHYPSKSAGIPPLATIKKVGSRPVSLDVNHLTNRVYVANEESNDVSVIDGATNSVIATIKSGNTPSGIAVNASTNRIYVANLGSGDLWVIDGTKYNIIAKLSVGEGNHALGVNTITNRIYVSNGQDNSVLVIDGSSNTVVATIRVDGTPFGLGVNISTNRIYVAGLMSNYVSIIDGVSNSVVATVKVGDTLSAVAVNVNTNRIYVCRSWDNSVSVIDGNINSIVAVVDTGDSPHAVAVNAVADRVYVANYHSGDISVLDGSRY